VLRRIVVAVALSACIVVAGGALAWRWHVGQVASLLDAQSATAQRLLGTASARNDPDGLVAAVGRNDVNAVVWNRATGERFVWRDGRAETPPGRFFPTAHQPPPGVGPMGPAPGLPPPRAGLSFDLIAVELAHLAPRRLENGDLLLILLPSARALSRWLLADAGICAAALVLIAGAGLTAYAAIARAARVPLVRTTLALEALAGGDFTPQTIEAGDAPEIARLARAYNAAAATVARSIEERQAAAAEFRRFLADAGHELRTPLTIVGGYVDVLSAKIAPNDSTSQRAISGMHAEAARMRGLVEKMLLLSRLESTVAAPSVIDVGEVSEEVREAMDAAFPGRQVTVRCDPAARVAIDEDDLYEAERNLVENALRYAPDSPVEIAASVLDGRVLVSVADRGPGIPPEEREAIFQRFYRGKNRGDEEGSGLGLAIVARVVERWGGSIALESTGGETRFTMTFPRPAQGAGA